jgi:hypothetical protein
MIINIETYVMQKLKNHDDKRMENTNYNVLRNIYDFIGENNLGIKGRIKSYSQNIFLKKQLGGKSHIIKLKDGKKYTYHLDKIESLNKKNTEHKICFLNINEDNRCLCFTYHTKETNISVLKLEDLIIYNTDKYIMCDDKNHKFKAGDILMQILIELVKNNNSFDHIKTIELQDNSIKRCYGIGLKLKYLRTITDGIPYYAKFGFRPIENEYYEIFCYNREHHKKINLISSIIIDEIFEKSKNKNNQEPYKIYKSLFKNFILSETKIDIKILLRKMIEYGENEKVDTKNKKLVCELLSYIIKPLYIKLGYKDYDDTLWALKIR